jgi:hypothetical protein
MAAAAAPADGLADGALGVKNEYGVQFGWLRSGRQIIIHTGVSGINSASTGAVKPAIVTVKKGVEEGGIGRKRKKNWQVSVTGPNVDGTRVVRFKWGDGRPSDIWGVNLADNLENGLADWRGKVGKQPSRRNPLGAAQRTQAGSLGPRSDIKAPDRWADSPLFVTELGRGGVAALQAAAAGQSVTTPAVAQAVSSAAVAAATVRGPAHQKQAVKPPTASSQATTSQQQRVSPVASGDKPDSATQRKRKRATGEAAAAKRKAVKPTAELETLRRALAGSEAARVAAEQRAAGSEAARVAAEQRAAGSEAARVAAEQRAQAVAQVVAGGAEPVVRAMRAKVDWQQAFGLCDWSVAMDVCRLVAAVKWPRVMTVRRAMCNLACGAEGQASISLVFNGRD